MAGNAFARPRRPLPDGITTRVMLVLAPRLSHGRVAYGERGDLEGAAEADRLPFVFAELHETQG